MGGGASKNTAKGGESAADRVKLLEKQIASVKSNLDITKEKVEQTEKANKEAKEKMAAKVGGVGDCTFHMVLNKEQATAVREVTGVKMLRVGGEAAPLLEGRENVVLLTVAEGADLAGVLKACYYPPVQDRVVPPATKNAPGELDMAPTASADDAEGGAAGGEEKQEGEEEEEAPKVKLADTTVKSDQSVCVDPAWDGKVRVIFSWLDSPSLYSEFNDPSGSNWWCHQTVGKAPGRPENVILEWRQGMNGKWQDIECSAKARDSGGVDFECTMDIPPEVEEGQTRTTSKYRGFQSRWRVDDLRYLSPLEHAPTLFSKLLKAPPIRAAVKALPPDKQGSFDGIENETLRNGIKAVENIMPMNTWDVEYDVESVPGAFIKGEHVKNLTEMVAHVAQQKAKDPALVSELRKTVLKVPITAATQLAGTAGIPLTIIAKNLSEFFLPKYTDPNFDAMQAVEDERATWDALRREMQDDANCLYPMFQGGLRVSFPEVTTIRNAMRTKRPAIDPNAELPVLMKWKMTDSAQYTSEHKIEIVYWQGDAFDTATRIPFTVEKSTEKFGVTREEKDVWVLYEGKLSLKAGTYRYHYLYDDKPFFDAGRPYAEDMTPGNEAYKELVVTYRVDFGIGVEF